MPWPGATGRLRAFHRQLDVGRSTELVPVLAHDVPQAVMPEEPMALDITIGPVGMRFHAGEQLQIVITGRTSDAMHPVDQIHQNIGKHIIDRVLDSSHACFCLLWRCNFCEYTPDVLPRNVRIRARKT